MDACFVFNAFFNMVRSFENDCEIFQIKQVKALKKV